MRNVFSLLILTFTAALAEISFQQVSDELNAPKNPTDRFRIILSNISESSVLDAVEDFTNYGCEKMVVIRNAAQAAIHLTCQSSHDAPKAVNIERGNAFLFTFRPRKNGRSTFWCNLEYKHQFARFDVYNENLPYMCPRAIHEVYQYTVRHDGVYVDHTNRSGESKIRALSKGHNSVILWEEFTNNETNGFLYSVLVDGGMCADLPDQFNDKPAAVTLCYNHCVHLYEHRGCLGEVQTVHAGNDCTDTPIVSSLVGKMSSVKGC
ncbi:hypothetical protein X975_14061, partial [Stegodyphus mimosarum]